MCRKGIKRRPNWMRKGKLEPSLPGSSFKLAYLLVFIQSNCQTGLYSNSDLYEYALKTVILEKLSLEYFLFYLLLFFSFFLPSTSLWGFYSKTFIHHYSIPLTHSFTHLPSSSSFLNFFFYEPNNSYKYIFLNGQHIVNIGHTHTHTHTTAT